MIGSFTGLLRELVNTKAEAPNITVQASDSLKMRDQPQSYTPLVISGPSRIADGPLGKALLIEEGQENIILDPSFENLG